jgi:hypothetical protein
MVQYNRSSSLGLTGYPARIFFEMTNYGRGTQTHLEKMVILEKWYSHLRAYLPVLYEKKSTDYNDLIAPKLNDSAEQIEMMNDNYDPVFESLASCSTKEKEFNKIMRGVFERLDEITAIAKVIEGINYEAGMMVG